MKLILTIFAMMRTIILYIIIFLSSCTMIGQKYTEAELNKFRENTEFTKALGRKTIIRIASKTVTDVAETIINDENIYISVFYNDFGVKVIFHERSAIRYIPYQNSYSCIAEVNLSRDRVIGGSMSDIIDDYEDGNNIGYGKSYLYRNTKEKEVIIDKVISLISTNDEKFHINKSSNRQVFIRERKEYYKIQIGNEYASSYKLNKKTGEIYDYEDPYHNFYPTPMAAPYTEPFGGIWIEMKE